MNSKLALITEPTPAPNPMRVSKVQLEVQSQVGVGYKHFQHAIAMVSHKIVTGIRPRPLAEGFFESVFSSHFRARWGSEPYVALHFVVSFPSFPFPSSFFEVIVTWQ